MTNLESLIENFIEAEERFGKGNTGIILFLHMPNGETELLANPNGIKKLVYLTENYTPELKHKNNEQVYVTGSNFFDNKKEVDITINLVKGDE